MLNLTLITSSLFIVFVLVSIYFAVGFLIKIAIKKITGNQVYFSVFKTILYGLLTIVYFYTIVKSAYPLNSVTITCVPILIYFYERGKPCNSKFHQVNYRNLFYIFLFAFFGFLIFYLAKYFFHFSSQINTGYSDQAFYHVVSSNLKLTGIETINIQIDDSKLIPGIIYHYWDLWFLAFHYDLLSILNQLGLFESLNQFEINVLVFQPSLFLILFVGFIELSFNISSEKLNIVKYRNTIVIIASLLVLCHSFLEFGIIHHPKQFFIASVFVFFILEIL
jgi:hypothetical protein